jgi:uroporphyrinogen decarboxylase
MTRRERVITALKHKEPDKIPIDCGGMRSTGLMGMTYNTLKRHLGIREGETKIYDMIQQLAIPEDWYLERFQIDCVDLARAFSDNPEDWNDWTLPDGTAAKIPAWLKIIKKDESWVCIDDDGDILAEMPRGSYFFDQKLWPLYGIHKENFNDLGSYIKKVMWSYMTDPLWKHAEDPGFYSIIRQKAKKLYEETDYFIMIGFGGQFFELGQYLYRNDEFMMNLILHRQEMEKVLDTLLKIHVANLKPLLEAVSPYVQLIVMGDDLGTQSAPMLSPAMYREIILPRVKKLYKLVKEESDIFIFLHTCGAVAEFIPSFIEAGVDVINPVQISAAGMEAEKLKREFGTDITFWGGGADTQHTLLKGSEKDVREEVRKNCEIFMRDGGFVFNQVHNMLYGIPPQNIVAMNEEVNKFRYK